MSETLLAHVRNGRLVLDEPSSLPEGTEVQLRVVSDELGTDDDPDADDLDDEDRERLHEAIRASEEEFERGEGVPASEIIEELRRRHP